MLKKGNIKGVKVPPKVINPLFVSENSVGKKHLILDNRYMNEQLYKDKIKFDYWKCFEIDLKSEYYHVYVFQEHQTYLGASWKINNMVEFFVIKVLQFGLSTASFVFTKGVRPLLRNWRFNSIKIACFWMMA